MALYLLEVVTNINVLNSNLCLPVPTSDDPNGWYFEALGVWKQGFPFIFLIV